MKFSENVLQFFSHNWIIVFLLHANTLSKLNNIAFTIYFRTVPNLRNCFELFTSSSWNSNYESTYLVHNIKYCSSELTDKMFYITQTNPGKPVGRNTDNAINLELPPLIAFRSCHCRRCKTPVVFLTFTAHTFKPVVCALPDAIFSSAIPYTSMRSMDEEEIGSCSEHPSADCRLSHLVLTNSPVLLSCCCTCLHQTAGLLS